MGKKKENTSDHPFLINFDELIPREKEFIQRHFLAPKHPFRMLIVGPSGCGKSNLTMNLIMNYLYYDKLYIFAKDLEENKYQFIEDFFEKIKDKVMKKLDIESLVSPTGLDPELEQSINDALESANILTMGGPDDIISPDELDKERQNLVIFDDMVTEKNKEIVQKIEDFFVRSRKRNCSCIYMTQSYFDTSKIIRLQCNYFAIFGIQSNKELIELRKEHSLKVTSDEFKQMYLDATEPDKQSKHNFLFIDTKSTDLPLNFRKNLDELYTG